jgi:hypothetical protein
MRRRRGRTSTGQHQLAHVRSVVAESRETPPSCRVGTGHRARTWSTALRHRPSLQSCVFTRGVRPRVAPTNPTVRPRRAYCGPANESAEAGGRRAPAITAHFEEYDHSDKAKRDACFHEQAAMSAAGPGRSSTAAPSRPAGARRVAVGSPLVRGRYRAGHPGLRLCRHLVQRRSVHAQGRRSVAHRSQDVLRASGIVDGAAADPNRSDWVVPNTRLRQPTHRFGVWPDSSYGLNANGEAFPC